MLTKTIKQNKLINMKDHGFSMVELMIVLAISSIIAVGVITSYSVQSKSFSVQRDIAKIQQDMRGALFMMEYDILNASRDPNLSNRFGFTDIRSYDMLPGAIDNIMLPGNFTMPGGAAPKYYFNSYPVLEFTSLRRDQIAPLDGEGDTPMRVRYQVFDFNNDGRLDLGRRVDNGVNPNVVGPAELVAEGVVAVAYAFNYNDNPNGKYQISRTPPRIGGDPLGTIIWAIDTNNNNQLDLNIDVNGDGLVNIDDDMSGDGFINALDDASANLPNGPIDIRFVTSVRIFLLLESESQSRDNNIDTNFYVVGDQVIPNPVTNPNGFEDRFKRRLKTITVALRNYRKS